MIAVRARSALSASESPRRAKLSAVDGQRLGPVLQRGEISVMGHTKVRFGPSSAARRGDRLPSSHSPAPTPTHGLPGWEELSHSGLLLDAARVAELARYAPAALDDFAEAGLRRRATAILNGEAESADVSRFVAFVLEEVCGFNAGTGTVAARQQRSCGLGPQNRHRRNGEAQAFVARPARRNPAGVLRRCRPARHRQEPAHREPGARLAARWARAAAASLSAETAYAPRNRYARSPRNGTSTKPASPRTDSRTSSSSGPLW